MNTASQPATTNCLVFLHPAAASSPDVIRNIHAATGLTAVAGNNPSAATLVRLPSPKIADLHDDYEGFEPFGGGAA